jgi:hypothetical protein
MIDGEAGGLKPEESLCLRHAEAHLAQDLYRTGVDAFDGRIR